VNPRRTAGDEKGTFGPDRGVCDQLTPQTPDPYHRLSMIDDRRIAGPASISARVSSLLSQSVTGIAGRSGSNI